MTLSQILVLTTAHFLGDWFFQTRKMADTKMTSVTWMGLHCFVVGAFFAVAALIWLDWQAACIFGLINAASHWLIDKAILTSYFAARKSRGMEFFTQNLYARDWLFYDILAADQMLHFLVLFPSFVLLTR